MNLCRDSLFQLSGMSYKDAGAYLKYSSSIVVPLGGLEPVGPFGALGVVTGCVEAVTSVFCNTHQILLAPVVNFSCSKPYKSFEGSAGVTPNTFCNILVEICSDWIFQGFNKILIVNPSRFNDEALSIATKRLNVKKEYVRVVHFHKYLDAALESVDGQGGKRDIGNFGRGILSLAAYFKPELIRENYSLENTFSNNEKSYTMWYRRGRDPQKFRKMFPEAALSGTVSQYNASLGKNISDYIVNLLEKEHLNFMIDTHNAAS
ncbi:MAG: creatininase family protein [Fibrobacter sp.]|nr:creatininase family protein [Fibrobacter sp.]